MPYFLEITNLPYTDLIQTKILDKLKMSNSTFKMYDKKNESRESSSYFFNSTLCPKIKYNACAPCLFINFTLKKVGD